MKQAVLYGTGDVHVEARPAPTMAEPPRSARAAAVVSLALWTAIVACGRLIAYV